MRVVWSAASLLLLTVCRLNAQIGEPPVVTHYALDVHFKLEEEQMNVRSDLTLRNESDTVIARLPFLLYRLLSVNQVIDEHGNSLPFDEHVVPMDDVPTMQVREVLVTLNSPLQPGETTTLTLVYGGYMLGYTEVMAYTKDRIDREYTLLRPDVLAYPIPARRTIRSVFSSLASRFTYDVSATVPSDYVVASGGSLFDTEIGEKTARYRFRSKTPAWRIDIAVARFSVVSRASDQLVVYYLPDDSVGAQFVLDESHKAIELYTSLFGRPAQFAGYTIIEIPDGWGSQASDFYFLQAAGAFRDSSRMNEVYHEIAHTWNAVAVSDIQRCRYFDEAFASFFAALVIRSFHGEQAFRNSMERSRQLFVRRAERNNDALTTPIADYWKKELGGYSYTKGAWSLYTLYSLVGAETFAAIIRTLLERHSAEPVDFRTFQSLCEEVTGRDLTRFFNEWIYGNASSQLLVDNVTIEDLVKRY